MTLHVDDTMPASEVGKIVTRFTRLLERRDLRISELQLRIDALTGRSTLLDPADAAEQLARAKERCRDMDWIDFDPTPAISTSEDGAWVAAWVKVERKEHEDEGIVAESHQRCDTAQG